MQWLGMDILRSGEQPGAPCAVPVFHPSIGVGNDYSDAALPNLEVREPLRDEVVDVARRE